MLTQNTSLGTATDPVRMDPTGSTTQPVSGPLTDTELRATPVPVSGTLAVTPPAAGTGTVTSVASSATSVTVLAANANRLGGTIFNDSTQVLYLKFGATASTSDYSVQVGRNAYLELPANYTGIIDGIWASVNGAAKVTEFTA